MKFIRLQILFVFLSSFSVFSQHHYIILESKLASLSAQLDSLTLIEKQTASDIDSLATKISQLKSGKELNYFQRRQLESLLKKSQLLGERQKELQAQISSHNLRRDKIVAQLVQIYSAVIDSLLRTGSEDSKLTLDQKAQILINAAKMQTRRNTLAKEIKKETEKPEQKWVKILPEDTPREIEEKADYINDQEDKLRQRAKLISEKYAELKTEAQLRLRMSELLDDIRLFDQHEESLNPSEAGNKLSAEESYGRTDWKNALLDVSAEAGSNPSPLINQLATIDIPDITAKDLDVVIATLETQIQNILNQADSLSNLAESFRKQAKSLRKKNLPKPNE